MTALLPQATLGDRICFDIQAGQGSSTTDSSEESERSRSRSGTETFNEVCVWNEPSDFRSKLRKRCVSEISTEKGKQCIWFPNNTFLQADNFKVIIIGEDALWIDRLLVVGEGKNGFRKEWGANDNNGWCMSMDGTDHEFWDGERNTESVPSNTCYAMMRFNANKSVDGWNTPPLPESELLEMGEDGKLYGRTTDGTYVSEVGGQVLQMPDGSGPMILEEGDRFNVNADGVPTVFYANGLMYAPDTEGPVMVLSLKAPGSTTPVSYRGRRRTDMAGEEELELPVEDAAGPFLRLADLLSASNGQK